MQKPLAIDATPAGDQLVIPDAERVRLADLAKRRAQQPLRANKPQAACDIGLFGDDARQMDLI